MQVFIDANIFLSFYHFTSEDLEQLKKLAVLIEGKELTLLLPRHVVDETWRNRSNKIKPALADLRQHSFAPKYPAYCRDYEIYVTMKKAIRKLEKERSALVEQIERDIAAEDLWADALLRRLFDAGTAIDLTEEIVAKARLRVELGNPPGKKGSLGDAVNWESLLAEGAPIDMHIISEDRDWYSPLDETKINEFLDDEWKRAKPAKPANDVHLYRSLTPFLKKHFPKIDLQVEETKQELILALQLSETFATTHRLVADLSRYGLAFSPRQVDDLYDALLDNSQVRWIITDNDILRFYNELYNFGRNSLRPRADEVETLLDLSK